MQKRYNLSQLDKVRRYCPADVVYKNLMFLHAELISDHLDRPSYLAAWSSIILQLPEEPGAERGKAIAR